MKAGKRFGCSELVLLMLFSTSVVLADNSHDKAVRVGQLLEKIVAGKAPRYDAPTAALVANPSVISSVELAQIKGIVCCIDRFLRVDIESKLDDISSKVDNITVELTCLDGVTSKIDEILVNTSCVPEMCENVVIIDSKIDEILDQSSVNEINSKLDVINSVVDVSVSLIEIFSTSLDSVDSKLDIYISKIDDLDVVSELDVIESKVDITIAQTSCVPEMCESVGIIDSKIDELTLDVTCLEGATSKIDEILVNTSCVPEMCESVDVIDSKIDALACDSSCIEGVCSTVDIIESKVFAMNDEINDIDSKVDILITRSGCCDTCTEITADMIQEAGYVITEPGLYALCESIPFAPSGTTAITIASNYVTLDMQGNSIYQTNATVDVDGIAINAGLHDVIIKDGVLHGFTRYGFNFVGASDSLIFNCRFLNCSISGCGVCACNFDYCHSFEMNFMRLHENVACALRTTNCEEINCFDCHFDDSYSDVTDAFGVHDTDSVSLRFEGCTFNNNVSDASDAYGLLFENTTGSIILNCTSGTNRGHLNCFGIRMNDSRSNNIRDCLSHDNQSEDETCGGYCEHGFYNLFQDCQAAGNSQTNSSSSPSVGNAIGFNVTGSGSTLLRCSSRGNTAVAGDGIGIYIDSISSDIVVMQCTAFSSSDYGIWNDSLTSVIGGCIGGGQPTGQNLYPGPAGGATKIIYSALQLRGNTSDVQTFENVAFDK